MTWLFTLRSKITGWAVAIAAALAILTGAYLKGRADNSSAATADRLTDRARVRAFHTKNSCDVPRLTASTERWLGPLRRLA
nr:MULTISPECIES: hypothetical protein [unclassified Ochrobactrum]